MRVAGQVLTGARDGPARPRTRGRCRRGPEPAGRHPNSAAEQGPFRLAGQEMGSVRVWALRHEAGSRARRSRPRPGPAPHNRSRSPWPDCPCCSERGSEEGLPVDPAPHARRVALDEKRLRRSEASAGVEGIGHAKAERREVAGVHLHQPEVDRMSLSDRLRGDGNRLVPAPRHGHLPGRVVVDRELVELALRARDRCERLRCDPWSAGSGELQEDREVDQADPEPSVHFARSLPDFLGGLRLPSDRTRDGERHFPSTSSGSSSSRRVMGPLKRHSSRMRAMSKLRFRYVRMPRLRKVWRRWKPRAQLVRSHAMCSSPSSVRLQTMTAARSSPPCSNPLRTSASSMPGSNRSKSPKSTYGQRL